MPFLFHSRDVVVVDDDDGDDDNDNDGDDDDDDDDVDDGARDKKWSTLELKIL